MPKETCDQQNALCHMHCRESQTPAETTFRLDRLNCCDQQVQFYYRATACNATHGIAVGILSVRLFVRPSVCLSVRQMRVL